MGPVIVSNLMILAVVAFGAIFFNNTLGNK